MPALRASVLIINHPNSEVIAFGADFAADFAAARQALNAFAYPVIALTCDQGSMAEALAFLDFASSCSPQAQRVIVQNRSSAEALRQMINTGSVFRILPSYSDARFDLTIQEALEEYRLLEQNAKLLQLVNEQNERLKRLSAELEERVEGRRKSLEEAKEKLLVTNHRVEALHRALVAIHRATSIAEMERLINEALGGALGLTWTRIVFQSQGRFENSVALLAKSEMSIHGAPLLQGLLKPSLRGKEALGHIYFARSAAQPFSRDETSFLGQVADAVSLAIDRLTKLEQSENLKQQWEATFDAILDPVSIIASDHTVVRINRSFADRSGTEPERVIGRKCFEALFGRHAPCEGCALGTNFRLKPARTMGGPEGDQNAIYDVFSQEIAFKTEERTLFVHMYHDVSSQLKLERQIVESAKMAELGTIGSSIAHELNNPLGGMLSFLQLIKMDLGPDGETQAWYSDIDEMEKGARRCRDIVQSLLGFTRKSQTDQTESIDLREVIEQALKITELQTRAMGLRVSLELPQEAVMIRGQFNALAQALRNFLQNAQEAIGERLKVARAPLGEIRVKLATEGESCTIEINDNGMGIDPRVGDQIYDPMYTTKNPVQNPGLGLTVSQQIIKDHGGKVEITSVEGAGTSAKISFFQTMTQGVSSSF